MDELKRVLTSATALKPIDYEGSGLGLLSVDSSLQGWRAVLQQEDPNTSKRHPVRYESGMWTDAKKKYDLGKLECPALLKAVKRFRYYLFGVRFLDEIDARTLDYQWNQPASDLPGSVVNTWLAWVRLFTFDIKHVAGTKHGGLDTLSGRGKAEQDSKYENPDDLEVQMHLDLAVVTVLPADVSPAECLDHVPQEFRRVIAYLLTLQRPDGMTDKALNSFKQYTLRFLDHKGLLFRRAKVNMSPWRVI